MEGMERSHPKLFRALGVLPSVFTTSLKEGTTPVCLHGARRLPVGLRKATEEQEKMESMGVREKVEKPTEWCSDMVVAQKSNGKVRIYVHLTPLNQSVRRESYPMPRLKEALSSLEGSRYFSKMNANSGFHQIGLSKESRAYTTFIAPFGRYHFCKLPFSISAAPEFFKGRWQRY